MKKVLYAAALLFLVTACTPKPESKPYTLEDDLHQRLLTDFSRTEDEVKEYIQEGLINIIGGCCGTPDAYIAEYPVLIAGAAPHVPAPKPESLWLSGLELLEVTPEKNFINVGERCNVAGSRKFLRLVNEKKYDEALSIARQQVEDGAQVVDVNMDDGLLDAQAEMTTFLNLIASEPEIARVPVMIDSSKWDIIVAG